jgi:hypothetical protein
MNFLCISNHNNDLSWVKKYPNPYIIYDRSDDNSFVEGLNYNKSPNVGFNFIDISNVIISGLYSNNYYVDSVKCILFIYHII